MGKGYLKKKGKFVAFMLENEWSLLIDEVLEKTNELEDRSQLIRKFLKEGLTEFVIKKHPSIAKKYDLR